ncbi:MAG: orotate phosphoribosyltransferase [SAR202 cluster bacterium]|nr:orotate phosphoribosyltransferase [SAR202 cluster bacterium]|tara:strand:+ start:2561 stop:3118 length:558 start_codon:yes stop_codon:yes gene_type:complete
MLDKKKRIMEIAVNKKALEFGRFTLTSGQQSPYYFDGRKLTLDGEASNLIAEIFLPKIIDSGSEFIAGPTMGADPIIGSVLSLSFIKKTPLSGLIIRKEAKLHGKQNLIEGNPVPGKSVVVVDDTCSTGGSLIHSIEAVEKFGCKVSLVLCILDRNMGGSRKIQDAGHKFLSIFSTNQNGDLYIN